MSNFKTGDQGTDFPAPLPENNQVCESRLGTGLVSIPPRAVTR